LCLFDPLEGITESPAVPTVTSSPVIAATEKMYPLTPYAKYILWPCKDILTLSQAQVLIYKTLVLLLPFSLPCKIWAINIAIYKILCKIFFDISKLHKGVQCNCSFERGSCKYTCTSTHPLVPSPLLQLRRD
jgi:hypothetical protein